ncbi:hypothetical protein GCM10010402_16940 [Actinomadura luteofluorescens]
MRAMRPRRQKGARINAPEARTWRLSASEDAVPQHSRPGAPPGTPANAHTTPGRRAHPELHGTKHRTYPLVSTYVVEPNSTRCPRRKIYRPTNAG